MKVLTSMGRARFEAIRTGILDGSLTEKWQPLKDKNPDELTRAQRVELRQLTAILNIFQNNAEVLTWLVNEDWRELFLKEQPNGLVSVEVKK